MEKNKNIGFLSLFSVFKNKINLTMKNDRKKFTKKVLILLLIIVAMFFVWKVFLKKPDSTGVSEFSYYTDTVKRGTVTDSISASGIIETSNMMAITTSVNGVVKKVYVNEGDTVVSGEKIMEITLDSEGEESLAQAWASYLSAKSSLDNARLRMYTLESALINSEEEFDNEKENNSYQSHDERVSYKLAENNYLVAEANYNNQKVEIEKAEVSLQSAWLAYQAQSPTITAPAGGVISNIIAVEGMSVENSLSERTSVTVASLKTEGSPIASLNITEMDINSVKSGQKAVLTLSSVEDTFIGTVVGIDKIGVSSSGVANYPVYVKFDMDSEFVLPNMSVDADIIIDKKTDVLYVPVGAVSTNEGKSFVTVINSDGQQVNKEVVVGTSDGTNTEIISGLEEGETVVIYSLPTTGFTSNDSGIFRGSGGGMGGIGGMMR